MSRGTDKHHFLRGKSRINSPHSGEKARSNSARHHVIALLQDYPYITPDIDGRVRRTRSAGRGREGYEGPDGNQGEDNERAHTHCRGNDKNALEPEKHSDMASGERE